MSPTLSCSTSFITTAHVRKCSFPCWMDLCMDSQNSPNSFHVHTYRHPHRANCVLDVEEGISVRKSNVLWNDICPQNHHSNRWNWLRDVCVIIKFETEDFRTACFNSNPNGFNSNPYCLKFNLYCFNSNPYCFNSNPYDPITGCLSDIVAISVFLQLKCSWSFHTFRWQGVKRNE